MGEWVRKLLYWWRTTYCPFLCGGRLPTTNGWDQQCLGGRKEYCPTCGRCVEYRSWGGWYRNEPIQAAPNPRSTK
jgi:hypothetical protein